MTGFIDFEHRITELSARYGIDPNDYGKSMHCENPNSVGESRTVMIAASSGEPKSLMSFLTPAETETIMQWSKDQPRSTMGAVDMMAWPGWKAVLERRAAQAVEKPKSPWFHLAGQ